MILGIVVGFILWFLIFAGIEPLVSAIAPGWTVQQGATYTGSVPILLAYLIRTIIASIVAGFTAALIAKDNAKTPLILGIVLFVIGLPIHIIGWDTLPVWYHVLWLGLLIPMTVLGGKLKAD
jgi:hypothetical protein